MSPLEHIGVLVALLLIALAIYWCGRNRGIEIGKDEEHKRIAAGFERMRKGVRL